MKAFKKAMILFIVLGTINNTHGQNLQTVSTNAPTPGVTTVPITVHSYIYIGKGNNTDAFSTATGYGTLSASSVGFRNSAFGALALSAHTTNDNNCAFGAYSMQKDVSGTANSSLGVYAMSNFISGNANNAFGNGALQGAVSATGNANNAFGVTALYNVSSGQFNCGFGNGALVSISNGSYNSAVGHNALYTATGSYNTALGYNALNLVTSGSSNVGIGNGVQVPVAIGSGQLSIQNIIYGINNTGTGTTLSTGYIGIGVVPSATTIAGTLPINTFSKLHIAGVNNTVPSLQLDHVPTYSGTLPVTNPSGTGKYLFVDAAGVVSQAALPASAGGPTTVANTISGTNFLTTTVNGVASAPVILFNLYSTNGIINAATTTGVNRTVDMNDRNIWFNTTNSPTHGRIYIGSNSLPTMFPTGTGNYRLYVEGGILTEKIKVAFRNTANWADYVFAEDYKLLPIKKLEAFVKKNKHLPGIDAADDLVKNGLDLGAMQAKQMGKIEELALYIIEQDKMLEKQGTEIETLKTQVKTLLEKSK